MKTRFNYPTRIVFGQGVIEDLASELSCLGARRPLVVTDRGLVRTGIPEKVLELLKLGAMEPVLFPEVAPNPTDAQVDAGAAVYTEHDADSIVALGGGSPMDAAKGIQIRIHHREPLEVYDDLLGGDAKITGPLPPLVAVPTTSGTGSEVSRSAVITIAAVDRKVVLFSPRCMPSVALCDPELTYDLPPRITAETGMDALSHNLEAFLSKGYHPMADAIALKGIQFVAANLVRAVENGSDEQARRDMMMASTMGAVAFQKGLGVVHSLAHPLSSVCGLSHGLANSIMMPHGVRFNGEAVGDRMIEAAAAMEAEASSSEGVARAIEALAVKTGLVTTLSEAGVAEAHIPKLVEKAMADGCHTTNPRPCTAEDMEALFRAAL
jgi:alcohol dehydrogenase class IV